MIGKDRALEIANQYLMRDGGALLRLMNIHFDDRNSLSHVTQVRYDKKGKPTYLEIPVWKEPVWVISFFFPTEGAANSVLILVNARTGELLEDLSM